MANPPPPTHTHTRHIRTSLLPRRNPNHGHLRSSVFLPFLGPTFQKLKRILKGVDIEVRHCSSTKLRCILSSHKDRRPTTNNLVFTQFPVNPVKSTLERQAVPLPPGQRNIKHIADVTKWRSRQSSTMPIQMDTASCWMKTNYSPPSNTGIHV